MRVATSRPRSLTQDRNTIKEKRRRYLNAERVEMEEKDIGNNKCTKISHGYSREKAPPELRGAVLTRGTSRRRGTASSDRCRRASPVILITRYQSRDIVVYSERSIAKIMYNLFLFFCFFFSPSCNRVSFYVPTLNRCPTIYEMP